MRDQLLLALRPDRDFAHRQALAELDQLAVRYEVARRRLTQEIHGEACRHRQRHPADIGKNRDINCTVGKRHQHGAGDRSAWTQILLACRKAHARRHRSHCVNAISLAVAALRELACELRLKFAGGHFWGLHACRVLDRYRLPAQFGYYADNKTESPAHDADTRPQVMPIAKAGAFDVDYTDVGSGPVVLLVHSSASGNRQWRRLADELKDRYRLIAVNLFGYGATAAWPAGQTQTLSDQAKLIVAAASDTDGPVTLVGHSMGGAVALETAIALGNRVQLVIVFEPILFYLLKQHGEPEAFAEIEAIANGFRARGARNEWESVGEMFVDYWSPPGSWAAMPADRRAGLLQVLPTVTHDWDSTVPSGRPIGDWGRIAAPVHVIQADDTRLSTRRVAAVLAANFPDWHFHRVAAGGHMAPLARPDLVNPLIASILGGARL